MVQLDLSAPDPFEIIVGTYEQFLLGFNVQNVVNEYKIEKSFATHSHLGSIRTVANSKHYLASGGADDSVCLYDMRYRIESGKLMHHNDTVNCVAFTNNASHLFTCSNDGSIAAIRCGNWQIEKLWEKAHKGLAVNTLAIHPTGKIALSTGADGILRTWNLIKGRQAYATNLVPRLKLDAKNVTVLKWSPNGEKYLLATNQKIDVYSVELAAIDSEINCNSKIICVEFLRDDLIAVGLENGQVKFYDLEKSVQTVDAIAHDIRVKCIGYNDKNNDLLVTASSSGEIKLWRFTKYSLDMLQTVNCGARITCMSLAMSCKKVKYKRDVKHEGKEDEEEEEEEEKEEKEKEIKEERKFRLRQEVVVEDEGAWEVTSIEDTKSKRSKKSKKKKRDTNIVADDDNSINVKEKKKKIRHETNESLPKNKRLNESTEDNAEEHSKKKKKKKLLTEDYFNNNSKKRKEHVTETLPTDIIPQAKKKKKMVKEDTVETSPISKKAKTKSPLSHESEDVPPKKKKKQAITEETMMPLKKKKKKQ